MDVSVLRSLIHQSNYNRNEAEFVLNGFTEGFDIGYKGTTLRSDTANNIPFTVGDKYDLWSKLMKEVKLKRVAGPFEEIPYLNYMQSPIELVPKAGQKTRLIFHLSYEFKSGLGSLNANTPKELCSVRYQDLDYAVKACLQLLSNHPGFNDLFYSKSDLTSAFRILPLNNRCYRWLIMMARDPNTNKKYYFADKNLCFGASISCSHFQRVSNCLCHIATYLTGIQESPLRSRGVITNYLDDFLFVGLSEESCNNMLNTFIEMCNHIGFPVAMDKTEFASKRGSRL